MTAAARSVQVFGFYLVGVGASLLAVPGLFLGLVGLPAPREAWIRVAGVLVLCLAYYYLRAARAGLVDFLRWSVQVRAGVCVAFAALAALGLAPAQLVLFGAVDLAGALWTAWALGRRAAA